MSPHVVGCARISIVRYSAQSWALGKKKMHFCTLFKLQEIKNVFHLVFHHSALKLFKEAGIAMHTLGQDAHLGDRIYKVDSASHHRAKRADAVEQLSATRVSTSVQNACDFPSFIEDRAALLNRHQT